MCNTTDNINMCAAIMQRYKLSGLGGGGGVAHFYRRKSVNIHIDVLCIHPNSARTAVK